MLQQWKEEVFSVNVYWAKGIETEGIEEMEEMGEIEDMGNMEDMEAYGHWLNGLQGVGPMKFRHLLSAFGTAKEIFHAREKELSAVVGEKAALAILEGQKKDVGGEYEKLRQAQISFYPFFHAKFPQKLRDIPDSPFGIYVKGRLPDPQKRSIAIVGARDCSGYGEYVAEEFGRALSQAGIQIISGMARGIDGIAGKAALMYEGASYAVLGCGVDICYPSSQKKLYQELCERGGVISTYVPGTQPSPGLFPPRNRIISGLADAVLVIEARLKSGTLITVDMALEQGREVYVVPGRITDRLSDGCNNLLLQGAGIALTPEQFIKDMEDGVWKLQYAAQENLADKCEIQESDEADTLHQKAQRLSEEEKALLTILDMQLCSMEDIYDKSQKNPILNELLLPSVMELLIELNVKGYVQCDGGYYRKTGAFT